MPERVRYAYAYAEDAPSCAVIRKLVDFQNLHSTSGTKLRLMRGFPEKKHGFGKLKKMIPAVINMVKADIVVLMLVDLDLIACAPELIKKWFSRKGSKKSSVPNGFIFRIAVREIESWLIADRDALASLLEISKVNFSSDPDSLCDPKGHLLGIIRAKGKRKMHREMLPGSNSRIGPEYNNVLCRFISERWDAERAAKHSLSLRRALDALKEI